MKRREKGNKEEEIVQEEEEEREDENERSRGKGISLSIPSSITQRSNMFFNFQNSQNTHLLCLSFIILTVSTGTGDFLKLTFA